MKIALQCLTAALVSGAGWSALQRDDANTPASGTVNPRSGVRWYRDVPYVQGDAAHPVKHRLDLYLPNEENWLDGRPLLIWIHGGGWTIGDKDQAFNVYGRYCRLLAERGIAAANVSYRLSPEVTHPAHVQDIAAATAYLIGRADQFGIDPRHVFASGHSAGGHLAALLATDDTWCDAAGAGRHAVVGAIPSSGVFDLVPLFGAAMPFGRAAFHGENAHAASPVNQVDAGDPPMCFIVEEYGRFMHEQTDRMIDALARAGVRAERHVVPNSHHVSMLPDLLDPQGVHLTSTIEFIRSTLADR
jgi:acetyl esterase/lipase